MLELITAMLLSNSSLQAVPAEKLAPAIVAAANRHNVSAVLITQIILVESRGVASAYNSKTSDHGLMQINERTRVAYSISKWCAKQWQCNLDSATRILADMYKISGARPCFFNIGPKGRFEEYRKTCEKYEAKLWALN